VLRRQGRLFLGNGTGFGPFPSFNPLNFQLSLIDRDFNENGRLLVLLFVVACFFFDSTL